ASLIVMISDTRSRRYSGCPLFLDPQKPTAPPWDPLMHEDPNEDESPSERALDPTLRAREKFDELRTHAELVAIFEGHRKFDAELRPDLNRDLARDLQ